MRLLRAEIFRVAILLVPLEVTLLGVERPTSGFGVLACYRGQELAFFPVEVA